MNSSSCIQQESYLLGDFNTNMISRNNTSKLFRSLTNFMNIFNLRQIIKEPTRIAKNSSSLLDLILTTDPDRITQSGVIDFGISDHSAIFCTRKINKGCKINSHNTCKIRCMKNFDQKVFLGKLNRKDWFKVLNCEQVDKAWSIFRNFFMDVVDDVAPVKEIRLKQKTESWFNGDIHHLVHERDKALFRFRKSKDSKVYDEYKMLRNKVQSEVKKAKRNYVKLEIKENKNCPKKLWKTIKELGISSKSKSACKIGLKNENSDEIIFDDEKVASSFNTFFSNIASKLVSVLPNRLFDDGKLQLYYSEKGIKPNSFTFTIVSEEEVLKLITSLNVSKSTGCDNISAKFVKFGADVICTPLTYIINLSLRKSTVPDDFKLARVVPLFKKGSRSEEGNYRPVSILPVLSKVFERIVFNQLNAYLCINNILYKYQSGFRPSFSTDTALTFLSDKIKLNMDKGLYTGLVLLDLQKAFDTVNHEILLKKLKAVGLREDTVQWFYSYISDRRQVVQIKDSISPSCKMSCGVPQGSILGPLLFSIYVNDMERAIDSCELYLYADDSAVLVGGKNISEIESKLSNNMYSLKMWLEESKLSLHLGKTESILFGSKKNCVKLHNYM